MEGGGSKEVSACATHTYIDRITQHRVDGTASANFVFTCGIAERSFYVAGFIFLFWPTAHENYLYFQITPPHPISAAGSIRSVLCSGYAGDYAARWHRMTVGQRRVIATAGVTNAFGR